EPVDLLRADDGLRADPAVDDPETGAEEDGGRRELDRLDGQAVPQLRAAQAERPDEAELARALQDADRERAHEADRRDDGRIADEAHDDGEDRAERRVELGGALVAPQR